MKHEVIIEYDASHGLTIPVSLSMSVANNVIGELIRCKDCKWHCKSNERHQFGYCECERFEVCGNKTEDTFFCGYAERKEE